MFAARVAPGHHRRRRYRYPLNASLLPQQFGLHEWPILTLPASGASGNAVILFFVMRRGCAR